MAITRPSKELYETKLDRERRYKKHVEMAQVIADGVRTPFWKGVKQLLEQRLKNVEIRLDAYDQIGREERDLLLAQRAVYREFLAIEDHGLDYIKEMLAKARADAKAYKEHMDSYSPYGKG